LIDRQFYRAIIYLAHAILMRAALTFSIE